MKTQTIILLITFCLILNTISALASIENEITGKVVFNTTEYARHWEKLSNLKPTIFELIDDDFAIKQVWINLNQPTENSNMKITKLAEKPVTTTLLDGLSFQFFKFKTSNILKSNVRNSKIIFRACKEWINENQIDPATIKLYKYKNLKWEPLKTIKTGIENNVEIEYESKTTEFTQYFGIGAQRLAPKPIKTIEKEPEPQIQKQTPTKSIDTSTIAIIIAIIFVFILIGITKTKKKK